MDQQSAVCGGLSDVAGSLCICCMLLARTLGLIVTLASDNTLPVTVAPDMWGPRHSFTPCPYNGHSHSE